MAAPSFSDFTDEFPELETYALTVQTWVERRLSTEYSGLSSETFNPDSCRQEATLLRVGHQTALKYQATNGDSFSGASTLTSKSTADWAKSWSVSQVDLGSGPDAYWAQTLYGLRYLQLRDSKLDAFLVSN